MKTTPHLVELLQLALHLLQQGRGPKESVGRAEEADSQQKTGHHITATGVTALSGQHQSNSRVAMNYNTYRAGSDSV